MKYKDSLQHALFVLPISLWAIFFFSCSYLQVDSQQNRSYQVSAPEWNKLWLRQSGLHHIGWNWKISHIRSSYQSDNWNLETLEASGSSIQINLKKQESAILEAFPVFAELRGNPSAQKLWRPGGAVIMWQDHSGDQTGFRYKLQANWFEGFRSYVLRRLAEGGFDIRYFNSAKLLYYMQRRMEQNPRDYLRNPWNYDAAYLITEISSLQMNWYDIRKRLLVRTFGMPTGLWQAFNTTTPALACSASCTIELPIGQNFMLELKSLQAWQLQVLPSGEVLTMAL